MCGHPCHHGYVVLWLSFLLCQSTRGLRDNLPVAAVSTGPRTTLAEAPLPQASSGQGRVLLGVQGLARLGRLVLNRDFPEASIYVMVISLGLIST